ncbi:MAG TPA: tRNA preQ1(34) S-adenosylmethionine ribosyltransferase-isomerase QueA [Rhizomicrobium sp.]|nr:tRNA preQ1(34) S-adenosylmethionine ribosyltransferase-isomerase QueA [Rhizomicrobium sp.]
MNVDLFDFDLPEGLVALRPAEPRGASRLLVVHPDGRIVHARFAELPDYLQAPDMLLLNDSRVIPARLRGLRVARGTTARIELLLHRRLGPARYQALARPARKLQPGDRLQLGDLGASVAAVAGEGMVEINFDLVGAALDAAVAAQGEIPLPPYIAGKRLADARDVQDYQTVYAGPPGSVAAPTAGLHFTPRMLAALAAQGVEQARATLHVGLGTFLPVKAEDTDQHRMHAEWVELDGTTAERLNAARARGGRILAVGTTALRTLESATDASGQVRSFHGETDIFITPGYRFRAADILLTNFHLPRSTLFMLVSAFMGLDVMRAAYAEAIRQCYRFYSYGDACLLLRSNGSSQL